jgi:hypothetical protein
VPWQINRRDEELIFLVNGICTLMNGLNVKLIFGLMTIVLVEWTGGKLIIY